MTKLPILPSKGRLSSGRLFTIPMRVEVEVKLKDASFKGALESSFSRPIPLSVDYFESNILVWRSSMEAKDTKLVCIGGLQSVLGRLCRVHEILWW